jgi:FMN phosphatase YigB (HAD superfamily)
MDVVFDLDGTLADITHRLHYIKGGRKDWPGFYRACVDDKPNYPVLDVYRSLLMTREHRVSVWSGRSDEVLAQTEAWLASYAPGYHELRMRKSGDYTPDDVLKSAWMEEHKERFGSYPSMAVDDRARVVAEWRKRGVVCLQVAEGDF